MIAPAALLLTAALAATGSARAAPDPAAYDAKAAPLDDLSKELLTDNGYELRPDGTVWDKIGDVPVALTDMPYLLSSLASARRLRALLEINNIITRYDSERHLTPEDREAVRDLVRKNWIVFGIAPRNDFRSYFSIEELQELDKIPPRFDAMGTLTMIDPPIESVTADAPSVTADVPSVTALPPAAAAAAPASIVASAAPPIVIPTLTPLMELPSLSRGSPFAPVAPAPVPPAPAALPAAPAPAPAPAAPAAVAAAPALPAPVPVKSAAAPAAAPEFKEEPAAPPAPIPIVAAPPAPSISSTTSANLGKAKIWTPPPAYAAAIAAAAKPAPAAPKPAAAAPPPPEPPKPAAVDEAAYEKFVEEGPYNAAGKAALELIGKRAPDFCLPLLRRTVVGAVPQIVSDGARTGSELRAGFTRDAANPLAPPIVALSPGPVFVEVKRGFFGSRDALLLPEPPRAWTGLGVARPALDALREGAAPVSTENGEWGAVRVYADGSRRGSYSTEEMTGELLEQLLLLGLSREGLDASPYAARRWARTARLMFYARLKDEMKRDNFLDPDRREELRGWLDRPGETDDLNFAVWSGSRRQLVDPRRGPPASTLAFESAARATCVRSALEDALAENSRLRAARVGALETMLDAGVVDAAAAKAAAQAAADAEDAARRRLLAAPPACPAPDPAREEGLRKASVLLAEAARAERLMRERKAGIEDHAD
ncbi:MAG TPA: hypothetical protein VH309_09240 [Elusimicrobiota bacterium]|nr:hypothetical protein [Elusimicrobiota bacterium]